MEIITGTIKNNQTGFTLIELLISMTIISIVVTGIVTSRMSQQNQSITQQQAVDVQQTVRAGLYMMVQELRMAGYIAPNGGYNENDVGIKNIGNWTNSDRFTIAYTGEGGNNGFDDDSDGTVDEADEDVFLKTISFWIDNSELKIYEDIDTRDDDKEASKIMAENIASINVTFRDKDNANTTIKENVRSIVISLTAQTPSNQIDRTAGNNNLRTLETIVTCRNLGL